MNWKYEAIEKLKVQRKETVPEKHSRGNGAAGIRYAEYPKRHG